MPRLLPLELSVSKGVLMPDFGLTSALQKLMRAVSVAFRELR
jgi:hypothetical protein